MTLSPSGYPWCGLLRNSRRLAWSCAVCLLLIVPVSGACAGTLPSGAPPDSVVPDGPGLPGQEDSGESGDESDFVTLGLEDLMNLTVTSVSRRSQLVSDAAAAVFVISQEDIRRSGATSIAEALRMVPGLEVARIDANKWAITSRGFNSRFANTLLVLFDGRTVYTQLFSGVFWDRQDTMLEDIDRIEVIRGPGAALWGANAVNGVINIITRSSEDSLGGLVTAGGGTKEQAFGALRYGGQIGADSTLRFYGKYTKRAGDDDTSGRDAYNGWNALRGGFRFDAEPSAQNSLTLQGDVFRERLQETYTDLVPSQENVNHTTPVFGANLLSRWKHTFSDTADLALQLYYDRTDTTLAVVDEKRNTFDIDFQNRFALTGSQEIIWGSGFRYSQDSITTPSSALSLPPARQSTHLFSWFLQDDITLVRDRAHLILGSKFEVNSYTGFEVQPNARLIWTPNRRHTVWGAVSRAVRTPSRGEETFSLYQSGPAPGVLIHLIGSDRQQAEELIAYELGYRVEPSSVLSADLATFYNRYRKLAVFTTDQNLEFQTPFPPQVAVPLNLGNSGGAETCGVELAANLKALDWWRLRGAYTYLRILATETAPGGILSNIKNESPHHQVSLRSSLDLASNVGLDLWLRYVSGLEFQGTTAAIPIDSYLTLDARLAWKPWKKLELSLAGQNLLQREHREFQPQQITTQATQVGRSVYGKVSWQF
jgi:iron complex outermembrane recepter protein